MAKSVICRRTGKRCYGAAAASRRTQLRWLKKARAKRTYLSRCKRKLGITRPRHLAPVRLSAPLIPESHRLPAPAPVGAGPFGRGGAFGPNPWVPYNKLSKLDKMRVQRLDMYGGHKLVSVSPGRTPRSDKVWISKDGRPGAFGTNPWYQGWTGKEHEIFHSRHKPTEASHGRRYKFATGPFKLEDQAYYGAVHAYGTPVVRVGRHRFRGVGPNPGGYLESLTESRRPSEAGLMSQIRSGDKVTFADRFGQLRTGRAVMPSAHGGWVLNMGGAHGTPAVVDERNVVRVKKAREVARNPELLVVNNPGNPRRRANMRTRRRRRSRNYWKGNKAGHRKAALKGWRKRSRKGGKRRKYSKRRKGAIKYHGKFYRRKALKNKIGKRLLKALLKKRGRKN